MKRKAISLVAVLWFFPLFSGAQTQSFDTSKSLDIFHSVLREISLFYVDSVAIDKLVYTGIEAMLSTMDPYTEFIPEEDNETIEMMTTGSYGGVGALIKKRPGDGILVSEPYAGSPAAKANLVAGDIILAIDGQPVYDMTADECSAKMKGEPGTSVTFLVKKLRKEDTISCTVLRERVHISDVGLACMLQDSIAYVRVTAFTQGGAQEVRKTLQSMKKQYNVKGIVLDLRGNGGGLMDEAVQLLSVFLPKHTMVVSAKGRIERFDVSYYTKEEPLDTKTPLVVLVNNGSASSSEIVAGAIQDLKRGTLVGQRTFGKGLVQTIRPLSYNANLKITTAKYYIPSGRCVQALDYSNRNEDGTPGATRDGGIMPDIEVSIPLFSRIAMELVVRDYIHEYSVLYYKNHDTINSPDSFSLTPEEYEDFIKVTAAKEFDDRSATEIQLDNFNKTAKAEGYEDLLAEEFAGLHKRLLTDKETDLKHYRAEIQSLLEEEICCRYFFQAGRLRNMIRNDGQLEQALMLF